MTTGLRDLQNISDARKTAFINDELLRLKVDVAALQEKRLAELGSFKEKDYTFFWQKKSIADRRVGFAVGFGVVFAVRNTLVKMVEPGDKRSESLLTLHLCYLSRLCRTSYTH